ncbi:eukaryotic translation initiation factor 4E-binding protein Mextli isoform X11 [Nasonia vitripennis]|uniref:Eukaryotic translation initiation factor 4E-binding protein Mextli n=1 Tax=Nasonia vitripennis TaxID=7425 RepID=A0A7M7QXE8_NASVI|nr:eukaryotic translation initiation factor 4E-binding protein Mextli isoform X11 [Nasonia vitripennis]XP_032455374.1 eukaryotic translation initiation factor 4E-binding protein Mextli isoform X11 [Nasonia vitripennis]XP_032455375.1 eukaryotic translation initiation factor 4E-binding protein Mextli isoform X11 [Nasonia vitripennis]XP_032455376.1 eukaryotic translation initiation factor 4E-binding protein Mextli isoform X11 [Nasonia vitripennis]
MATTLNARPRTIKKLEKPRPLKISQRTTTDTRITTVDDIVSLIDNVAMCLNNGYYDQSLQSNIVLMCNHLKLYSHQLEMIYKDQLDRAFIAIRNGSQNEKLDMTTRVHLLELIELRAKQWHHNESMNAYYSQKLSNLDNQNELLSPDTPTNLLTPSLMAMNSGSPPLLGPGEVIKNSGKFTKPTRIPGKNYCKDEVVIRNSDSGKVNPGAKERLVQITGTSEDKIHYAKDLIKDTIQRNASPVRLEQGGREKSGIGGSSSSLNSSASDESSRLQQQHSSLRSLFHSTSTNDASLGEFMHTVTVGPHSLKITGSNLELVRAAKLALDEYFSEESEHTGSGVEYFTFDDESSFAPVTPTTPHTPLSAGQASFQRRNLSYDTGVTVDTDRSKEVSIPEIEPKKNDSSRELSYEFLMQCAKGPFAKRPPADWDRIQKECPNIVRKHAASKDAMRHRFAGSNRKHTKQK